MTIEPRGLRPLEDEIVDHERIDLVEQTLNHIKKMPPDVARSIMDQKFLEDVDNTPTLRQLSERLEANTGVQLSPEQVRQRASVINRTAKRLAGEQKKAPTQ
jgi:hypothetical protein